MRIKLAPGILITLIFTAATSAQTTGPADSRAQIPPDATRRSMGPASADGRENFGYFDAQNHLLAAETVITATHQPIARILYADGKRSGLSETWYDSGARKTAGTWKDGLMQGAFRAWDEKGQLVGCWTMDSGAGTETVYFPNGKVDHIYEYKNNARVHVIQCYPNGQVNFISGSPADEKKAGEYFAFHPDGALRQYLAKENPGPDGEETPNGPLVEWDAKGTQSVSLYFAHGEPLEERRYRGLQSLDTSLPAIHDRPWYEARIPAELKQQIKTYKDLPPVTIPIKDPAA